MRTSFVAPGGDPPSIGNWIVRPQRLDVNYSWLPGKISEPEQQPAPAARNRQLPLPHQTPEVILVVTGPLGRTLESDELVVLRRSNGVEVSEDLLA